MSDSSKKSPLNIPTFEQVEKQKAQQSKQMPLFFKSKVLKSQQPNESPVTASLTTPNTATGSPSTSNPPSSISRPTPASNPLIRRSTANTILVNPTQQKNPILKHVHNVPWEPSEAIKVDYVVGQTTGVIYLSLRYHRLYPTYIYDRLASVRHLYVTRILLVYVDVDAYHDALREINRIAILSDFTLMLAWSPEEAGRYLETYKAFEHKTADLIRERVQDEYLAKMTDSLTQIRSVNKTDVLTLLSTFGSLKQISEARTDQLAMCPGFGEQKVRRLQQVWKQPFLANKKPRKT
jgi:DNA excision repair protein ERCC-1